MYESLSVSQRIEHGKVKVVRLPDARLRIAESELEKMVRPNE